MAPEMPVPFAVDVHRDAGQNACRCDPTDDIEHVGRALCEEPVNDVVREAATKSVGITYATRS